MAVHLHQGTPWRVYSAIVAFSVSVADEVPTQRVLEPSALTHSFLLSDQYCRARG